MPTKAELSDERAPFEREVEDALQRLRLRLSEVIGALPNVSRAIELHRALGIDRNLSWRVFKVATAANPLAAGPHVPGPANLKTFFNAAAKHGVPKTVVARSIEAAANFERVVKTHAGDRATFESMVSGLATAEDAEQVDLQYRRAAFRSNRHIWGVCADVKLRCSLVQPSDDPTKMDYVQVEGYVGLNRLRHAARLIISRSRLVSDKGELLPMPPMEPLDPGGTVGHGVSLLRDFCSNPLPPVKTSQQVRDCVEVEFESSGLGNTAAIDCVTGWLIRGSGTRYRDAENVSDGFSARVRLPSRVLIHDMLVRRGTYAPTPPTATMYVESIDSGPYPGSADVQQPVPLAAPVMHVGQGLLAVHTPDVPHYPELASYIFDRLGWDPTEFSLYRCRVECPVMPSSVVIRFNRLDAPA